MSHTPGPWRWIKQVGTDLLIGGERSTIILDDACCNPQDMALIASAPDLLAECRRIHDRIGREIEGPLPMTERDHDDYVRLARVIAKAERK